MAGSPEQPSRYRVDRLPAVTEEIRRLFTRGQALGIGRDVLDSLEFIVSRLETEPLEWGDPEYATKKEGGLVLHGLRFPFIVRYVVFRPQRLVCILQIRPYPQHPLETEQ